MFKTLAAAAAEEDPNATTQPRLVHQSSLPDAPEDQTQTSGQGWRKKENKRAGKTGKAHDGGMVGCDVEMTSWGQLLRVNPEV